MILLKNGEFVERLVGYVKQTFQQLAQNLDNALDSLKGRQQYIEQQEPQYKQQ